VDDDDETRVAEVVRLVRAQQLGGLPVPAASRLKGSPGPLARGSPLARVPPEMAALSPPSSSGSESGGGGSDDGNASRSESSGGGGAQGGAFDRSVDSSAGRDSIKARDEKSRATLRDGPDAHSDTGHSSARPGKINGSGGARGCDSLSGTENTITDDNRDAPRPPPMLVPPAYANHPAASRSPPFAGAAA